MTFYEAFLNELNKLATKAFFVGGKRMATGPGGALVPFRRKTVQVPKTSEQKLRKQVSAIRAKGADPGLGMPTKMKTPQIWHSLKKARTQAQQLGATMY